MAKLLTQTTDVEQTQIRSRVLRSPALLEQIRSARSLRSALPFLSGSLVAGLMAVLLTFYTPCYVLTVEGAPVGHVRDHEMVDQTARQVEGQVSQILGEDYTLALDMEYSWTLAAKDSLISYASLSDRLYGVTPEIKQAYVLSVDGADLGAAQDKAALDAALQSLKEQYANDNTQEMSFANEYRITRKYIPAKEDYLEGAQLLSVMTQPVAVQTAWEVQEGDTLAFVAEASGMTLAALLAENPGLGAEDSLTQGQMVTVRKSVPVLSVYTVDQLSYTQALESPCREVEDSSLYIGETKLLTQGIPGEANVEMKVTKVNGEVVKEEIIAQTVTRAPTDTLMAVGTKERPAYYSTGALQWPCSGRVTSPFGYRNIFGGTSFHSGLDIANSNGTAIVAADSGVVTYVGYKGTYGNLVIIDHGNGWVTYYAHCAQTLVSEGDGVQQGSQIATMGSTGRATGNHCHFELRVNGEAVNPQAYLS